jgi:hypothetical protein
MIVYYNGDKVILTEERFKTMFTLFVSELNKDRVSVICSTSIEISKPKMVKDAQREDYNMGSDEAHPARLMIPRFQYGDISDTTKRPNKGENLKLDISDTLIYNNNNAKIFNHT